MPCFSAKQQRRKEEYKDKYQFIKADSINDDTIKVYVNSIIDFIKVKPK